MPIVEESLELEDTWTEVVDFAAMARKNNLVEVPAPEPPKWDSARYGNAAQWAGAIFGGLALFLTLWFHYTASESKASDEHVGAIVSDKLNPVLKDLEANIDKKFSHLNDRMDALTQQVGQLQGRFEQLDTGQKKLGERLNQQEAFNRLQDPRRILAIIKAELRTAQTHNQLLPASQVADYKNAVRALPSSTEEYWETLAAIINYQSLVNQLSGKAPDPSKVSRPCFILTGGLRNRIEDSDVSGCIVDLDTQEFKNVTFRDSVIRYAGGPVSLANVQFINCGFVLTLATQPRTPAQKDLLFALLNSPDQKAVQVPE
jgi:hypothetical protein